MAAVLLLGSPPPPASGPAVPPDVGASAATPRTQPASPIDVPASTVDTAPAAAPDAPAVGSAPPNLADPTTPLPNDLQVDEPVRLVVEGVASDALAALEPSVDVVLDRDGINAVALPADELAVAVDSLRSSGATRIEVDAFVTPDAVVTPTDPLWLQWWGARQFGLPSAWAATQGNAETVIAIIDSGVSEVAELSGRVLPGTTYLDGAADPRLDLDGHGTSSAIVAAGAINNGVAAGGSCPQCLVLPIQVLDPATGSARLSAVAAGIRWATDNGADVISISLGGPSTISALSSAVAYANSRGVPVIASAGNDGDEALNYPAGLTNVIGVAALGSNGTLTSWSTRGTWVTTAAAGCNITQRSSDGNPNWFCGTSSSAPLLAGAVALLDSRFPDLTVAAITTRVEQSSTPGVLTAHGSASAAALVTAVVPPGAPTITAISPGSQQVAVTVSAPANSGGGPVTGYEVSLDGGPFTPVGVDDATSPSPTFTLAGLVNGTTYRVRVRAVNLAGAGTASTELPATPRTTPSQISEVTGESAGSTAVRFSWVLPGTGGAPLDAVELQWSSTPDLDSASTLLSLEPTATAGLVERLDAGTTVYARVRARNVAGAGSWSAVSEATSDTDAGSPDANPPDPMPISLARSPFVDVPLGSWFDMATRWAFSEGITQGVSSTTFGARSDITRAQWITMLWRLDGRPTPGQPNPFTDVAEGAYYAPATAWAAEVGVSEGIRGTTQFRPDRPITRAEIVTMLWRRAGRPQPVTTSSFDDVPASSFYSLAVAWARQAGVTTGVGTTGLFNPSGQSTRAEAITLLWRQVGSPTSLPPR